MVVPVFVGLVVRPSLWASWSFHAPAPRTWSRAADVHERGHGRRRRASDVEGMVQGWGGGWRSASGMEEKGLSLGGGDGPIEEQGFVIGQKTRGRRPLSASLECSLPRPRWPDGAPSSSLGLFGTLSLPRPRWPDDDSIVVSQRKRPRSDMLSLPRPRWPACWAHGPLSLSPPLGLLGHGATARPSAAQLGGCPPRAPAASLRPWLMSTFQEPLP